MGEFVHILIIRKIQDFVTILSMNFLFIFLNYFVTIPAEFRIITVTKTKRL